MRKIAAATDVPVEVFVHGALCVAYSGQCLTSESLGGRSANRGQCAQACRLPYELIVDGAPRDLGDKAYLLSPQDLAAYDLIGDLADVGVCSFKIEGRLKSAHYVAATTQTYRAAIDAAAAGRPFGLSAPAGIGPGPELLPRLHPRLPRRRQPSGTRPRPLPQEPRRPRRPGRRQDAPRRAGGAGAEPPRPQRPSGFAAGGGPERRRRRRLRRGPPGAGRAGRAGSWPSSPAVAAATAWGRGDVGSGEGQAFSDRHLRNGTALAKVGPRMSVVGPPTFPTSPPPTSPLPLHSTIPTAEVVEVTSTAAASTSRPSRSAARSGRPTTPPSAGGWRTASAATASPGGCRCRPTCPPGRPAARRHRARRRRATRPPSPGRSRWRRRRSSR